MSRGVLIAFEGADGNGKSTQARLLAERLHAVLTRQAGGTELGQRIREITLDSSAVDIALRAEALLYMADRAEQVEKIVKPALATGRHVVSDRWAYSSIAFQGYGRGLDIEELQKLADWSMQGLWPSVVVLLQVPGELAHTWRVERNEDLEHYQVATVGLQQRVTAGYQELAAADPDRWKVVDGVGSVEQVAERVWAAVAPAVAVVNEGGESGT